MTRISAAMTRRPANWGPPTLTFTSGIAGLTDGNSSFNRARTDGISESVGIYRGRHNISAGGDFRKQEYNDYFEQNPRGAFGFTGAATTQGAQSTTTGSDFADFLIGIPDTSSIAFGNPARYLRENIYDAFFNRRLARSACTHHQCGRTLGVQRADHGAAQSAGESRYQLGIHAGRSRARVGSGGSGNWQRIILLRWFVPTGPELSRASASRGGPFRPPPLLCAAATASIATVRCIRPLFCRWRSRPHSRPASTSQIAQHAR